MKQVNLTEGASITFWNDGTAIVLDNPYVGVGEREGQVRDYNYIPLALVLLKEAGAEIIEIPRQKGIDKNWPDVLTGTQGQYCYIEIPSGKRVEYTGGDTVIILKAKG